MKTLAIAVVLLCAAPVFAEDGCPATGGPPVHQEGEDCSTGGECAPPFTCLPNPDAKKGDTKDCRCRLFPDVSKGKK